MKPILYCSATTLATACSFASAADATRPNIPIILAVDWCWGGAGAYGPTWIQTPAIDRMASQGPRFAKCIPSRVTILTGRNSRQLKEADNNGGFTYLVFKTYPEVPGNP